MDAYETTIYTAVLIGGVFVAGLTLYFVLSVIAHQRKHTELQRRYFLDEIKLLEQERTRIAQDLHDELAPSLSLTKFQLESLAGSEKTDETVLIKASRNLEQVMLRMGEIAADLNASKLVQKGLDFALTNFLTEMEPYCPMRIEFDYAVKAIVSPEAGIHLYRIAQEILHNAIKHSAAQVLRIQVKQKGRRLQLFVSDDGRGMPCSVAESKKGGMGMASIRSRTGLLGGQLILHSEPGLGTHYFIDVPLDYHGKN